MHRTTQPSGVTEQEHDMTTTTLQTSQAATGLMSIAMIALIGATLVFAAGFANSGVLHDAAHDTRHSTGFPCH